MTILNECKYAEKCLEVNSIGENLFQTLSILSKYFYHKKGYSVDEIEQELISFSEKNYKNFEKKREYISDFISKVAKNARNNELREIDGVWITTDEIRAIQEIGDNSIERLLFSMLCYAKLNLEKNPNSNGWVNGSMKDIFATARVSGKSEERAYMARELRLRGYIEKSKKNTQINYRVLIIDKDGQGELFVDDFRELGYEYQKYCGQNFIRCAECGILTRGNKNGTRRYCSSCASYKPVRFDTKKVICVDCGTEFEVPVKVNTKKRCYFCQKEYIKEYDRARKKQNSVSEF